jgi:hypothetical protein
MVKHGQEWAAADGGGYTVIVSGVRGDWVGYTWRENDKVQYHEKTNIGFQSRYCLVVDTRELPQELK